jgi:F0F1-type ATP synthase membrane subunit b/b'
MIYLILIIVILLIILLWVKTPIIEGAKVKDFTKDIQNLTKDTKNIPKKAKQETDKAKKEATSGINKAKNEAKAGLNKVKNEAKAGINKAKNEAKSGINKAKNEAKSGFNKLKNETTAGFNKVKNEAKAAEKKAAGELKKAINEVKKEIMKEVDAIKNSIMKEIKKITDLINMIQQKIKNIINAFKNLGPQLKNIAVDAIVKPFTALGIGLQKIFVQVGNIFMMVIDKIVSIPGCVLYYIVDAFAGIFNGMYYLFPVSVRYVIHQIYIFFMFDKFGKWILYITGYTAGYIKCTSFNVMPAYEKMTKDGKQISNAFKNGFGHFKPLKFNI